MKEQEEKVKKSETDNILNKMKNSSVKHFSVTKAQKRGVSALLRNATTGVLVITRNNMPAGIIISPTHTGLDNAVNLLYNAYEFTRQRDLDLYDNNFKIEKKLLYDMFRSIIQDFEFEISKCEII